MDYLRSRILKEIGNLRKFVIEKSTKIDIIARLTTKRHLANLFNLLIFTILKQNQYSDLPNLTELWNVTHSAMEFEIH